MSVAGVIPWPVADNATAELACVASGKLLCTPDERRVACKGPEGTAYAHGHTYARRSGTASQHPVAIPAKDGPAVQMSIGSDRG